MKTIKALAGLVVAASCLMINAANSAETTLVKKTPEAKVERALFAEGCFWKVQYIFSKVPGVVQTKVGYSGGSVPNPNYKQVCTDKTGHAETCLVEFDPTKTTYQKLLETFFASHNPTTLNRQGPDIGAQYRSVIFYTTPEQQREAEEMKDQLNKAHKFSSPIVTEIKAAQPFYAAEDYHQNYFAKNGEVCY